MAYWDRVDLVPGAHEKLLRSRPFLEIPKMSSSDEILPGVNNHLRGSISLKKSTFFKKTLKIVRGSKSWNF